MVTNFLEIKEKLVECGVKSTHQRMRILESLEKMGHADAKELHLFLIQEMPSLSKTTVYNTLDALHRAGLVSLLSIPGEGTRYELAEKPHCHFLCRKCGKIIDMSFSCRHADSLRLDGYLVEELLGCFKGVCKTCQARDANRPGKGTRSALPKTGQRRGG
jgi:Fe2+ or Zn2+ uptake regulation protein